MTPAVMELQDHYSELKLPVVILTGADDQIVDISRNLFALARSYPRVNSSFYEASVIRFITLLQRR